MLSSCSSKSRFHSRHSRLSPLQGGGDCEEEYQVCQLTPVWTTACISSEAV